MKWMAEGIGDDCDRAQKIAFAELGKSGVRGLLVYCADYRCSHLIAITGAGWPDDLRLSDIGKLSFSTWRQPDCRSDN
jgi:hypothetical protein